MADTDAVRSVKNRNHLFSFVLLFLAIVWNYLDANPTLFAYDVYRTALTKIPTNTNHTMKYPSLQGKTIWVTGASSGIGAEMICQLIQSEAGHVILSARRIDKMEEVAKRCTKQTPWATTKTLISIVPYDAEMSTPNYVQDTVRTALALVQEKGGKGIDMMIFNAGIYQCQPALRTSIEESRKLIQINFVSTIELTTTLLQEDQWQERGYGHLVVVSSTMGRGGHSLSSTYTATKHALRGYFHSLSTEEFQWLRVDIACPGATETSMWDANQKRIQEEEEKEDLLEETTTKQSSFSSPIPQPYGPRMTPDRVVQLLFTGITGPYFLFYETWICKTPNLLWLWLSLYTPGIFHGFIHWMGYIRVQIYDKEQLDVFDVPKLISTFTKLMFGKY